MKNLLKTTITLAALFVATIKRISQYGAADFITEYTYFVNATPRRLKADRVSRIVDQLNSSQLAPEPQRQASEPNPGQMLDDDDIEVFQHAGEIQNAITDMHGNKPISAVDNVWHICALIKNQSESLDNSIAFFQRNLSDENLFSEDFNRRQQLRRALAFFDEKRGKTRQKSKVKRPIAALFTVTESNTVH